MEPLPLNIPPYPMLRWITHWGGWLAGAVPVVVVLAGLAMGAMAGSLAWVAGGTATGALAFVVLRALVELVRLICDMLLPK